MTLRNPQRKKRTACPVKLAVAAVVEGSRNPLDEDMSAVSLDRTSLDLPEQEDQATCCRCAQPAVERCPECGSPLCGGSVVED